MPKTPFADREDSQTDGCELDFTQSDETLDSDLPAATGGVEPAPRTGRAKPTRRSARRVAAARTTRTRHTKRTAKRK
jgi:hypothetical protein